MRLAVITRGPATYEIWGTCGSPNCDELHSLIATCRDRYEANRIARSPSVQHDAAIDKAVTLDQLLEEYRTR